MAAGPAVAVQGIPWDRARRPGDELLQVAQADRQFVHQFVAIDLGIAGERVGQFVEAMRQVAVVVEGFDQEDDDVALALRQLRQRRLGVEVLAQSRRGCLDIASVNIVFGVAGNAVAAGRLAAPAQLGAIVALIRAARGFFGRGLLLRGRQGVAGRCEGGPLTRILVPAAGCPAMPGRTPG